VPQQKFNVGADKMLMLIIRSTGRRGSWGSRTTTASSERESSKTKTSDTFNVKAGLVYPVLTILAKICVQDFS
jgi:hypothetical protein